jgi:hypothetical protein
VIEEHPSALRADIARYFPRWDLDDFHRNETGDGTMSWLRLWELFLALPDDSMTWSVLSGDHGRRRWTERDYLIAALVERQQDTVQMLFNINSDGSHKMLYPPVNRPDLRTSEQIEAEAEQERRRAAFVAATRPRPVDPEIEQKLAAALERQIAEQHPH